MSNANVALVVVGGGLVAFVAVKLLRRAAAPAPATAAADPCEMAKALGSEAYLACKAAQIVGALATGESAEEADSYNVPLNGPIVGRLEIDPRYHSSGQGYVPTNLSAQQLANALASTAYNQTPSTGEAGRVLPAFKGNYVSIYANGCVPLTGDKRFAKCRPGTHQFNHIGSAGNGREWNAAWSPSQNNDPLTHEHYDHNKSRAFPLQCPPGARRMWVSGKPVCCAGNLAVRHNADGSVTSECVGALPPAPVGMGQVVPADYVNPVKLAEAKANCQRQYSGLAAMGVNTVTLISTCERLAAAALKGKP